MSISVLKNAYQNKRKQQIIMAEWILYLDESGNTGTNMFDEKQSFYVYAGWLIKKEDMDSVTTFIKESFKIVKAKELKSVSILKKYRPKLFAFLQNSISNGMFPFYYVFEKRHYICCKIVDTFFDYFHNSNVPFELASNYEKKKELCGIIYHNEKLLRLFSNLITDSTLTIEEMRQIKELLIGSLDSEQTIMYKDMIYNVTTEELYSMINEFECVAINNGKIRQSPAATQLYSILKEVEKLMRINGGKAIIVVDELKNKTFINDIKNMIESHSSFLNIISIETVKSEENIVIQAADLLSGYINKVFNNDSRIVSDKESQKINIMFDVYNKTLHKYGIFPLNHASYER